MALIAAFLLFCGGLALFSLGWLQLSESMLGPMGSFYRRSLGSSKGGRFRAFWNGLIATAISGIEISGLVFLGVRREMELLEPSKVPWLLLGAGVGRAILALLLALVMYLPVLPWLAALLFLGALFMQYRLKQGRKFRTDWVNGTAMVALALAIFAGQLNGGRLSAEIINDFRNFSASIPGMVLLMASGLGAGILFRSSLGVQALVWGLLQQGMLEPSAAYAIALGSLPGPALIMLRISRFLQPQGRLIMLQQLVLLAGTWLWGAILLFAVLPLAVNLFTAEALMVSLLMLGIQLINALFPGSILGRLMSVDDLPQSKDDANPAEAGRQSLTISLDASLVLLQGVLGKMADKVFGVLMQVMNTCDDNSGAKIARDQALLDQEILEVMEEELAQVLDGALAQAGAAAQAARIQHTGHIGKQLLELADISVEILRILEQSAAKGYRFHVSSQEELFNFSAQVLDFFRYASDFLSGRLSRNDAAIAQSMEDALDKVRDRLKKRSRKILVKNNDADPNGELAFIEIVEYLERIGDHCLVIARSVNRLEG